MPTYDLKRAYIAHIKSLDPAQRRQFGENLRAAIGSHISEDAPLYRPLCATAYPTRRDQNALFADMTRNLEPDVVMNALQSLRDDTLNQFLTHQADRLNQLNNQQAQPQNAPQAEADGLDYQPDVIDLNDQEEKQNVQDAPQAVKQEEEDSYIEGQYYY